MYSKFMQFSNIKCIDCVFEVLKLDKSNEVNDEQPEKI